MEAAIAQFVRPPRPQPHTGPQSPLKASRKHVTRRPSTAASSSTATISSREDSRPDTASLLSEEDGAPGACSDPSPAVPEGEPEGAPGRRPIPVATQKRPNSAARRMKEEALASAVKAQIRIKMAERSRAAKRGQTTSDTGENAPLHAAQFKSRHRGLDSWLLRANARTASETGTSARFGRGVMAE